MYLALVGGKVVTPFREIKNGTVLISEDKIYEIGNVESVIIPENTKTIDVSGHIICPGFVDLLVHGGGGYGFADGNTESYRKISRYFLEHGSTYMLASLHAKPEDQLLFDMKTLSDFIKENPDSNIKGIHMEGPFLNPELKGAMNETYLWKPTIEGFLKLWEASDGLLKMMTIAPELDGAIEVIREASFRGVVCSVGHSTGDYEVIVNAIDNGAAHVTHMFNAMKPFHHRFPSVITAAMLRDELKIELIADTYHVHPAIMELLLKVKTPKGIILITDSIRAGGMHEGEYHFSDQKVFMKDNKAFLADGTLAGSTLTLNMAVKNIIETTGTKLTDAIRMASLNGSKVVNAEVGILASGKQADIVVMNNNFDVIYTIVKGELVYEKKFS
ncbi:MAG: N-acetylglucosamine-6-phosphate deacetylase [Ignavibacteriae bacterium HGW-Ignavibacteriae-2]|jgi:N-acetylglucosamine-6-phosphate deacetylase|nr:MAG: N-acetylglucosamine-6-phosphate deacetylase [Ignavibacteriae bacterium HGW-Ignavibacteriae-2]